MSDEQGARYARHLTLPEVGPEGQRLLGKASVLVVGAGGLGSPALLYLAAAGIGQIGVIDDDSVDISNLQRQVLHDTASVGDAKVVSARRRLTELNPEIVVEAHEARLGVDNALGLIGEYDVVIDGSDNFSTRYLIGDACEILGRPWVFGSIHRFEGQVATFNFDGSPNYRDLFPEAPPSELAPNCAEAGVLGVLPGIVGSIQATEAIKIVLGIGEPLIGRLLVIDALGMRMRSLSYSHDPSRPTVTELSEHTVECSSQADVIEELRSEMLEISPADYAERVGSGWTPFLLDVRRADEERLTSLEGTSLRIQHNSVPQRSDEIPRGRDVVVYCRTGVRSAAVARYLVTSRDSEGRVYNLSGGIHEWSDTVDSSVIKY
ncbi:MAG: molybdopterin-synthase adenylyltransferase MoeB [Candidatus Poseidoniales archaeon]|nr:molybdopterin-synthase adenylyltransferase MoeB [Candidatus Poseidoniales archaeon]